MDIGRWLSLSAMADEWWAVQSFCAPTRRYTHSVEGAGILDVAPTVLELMGIPAPEGMEGSPIELISKVEAFP
jgi:bisphosphoglycerate-independent phosphoglycerate mutase (AlkP superfamily)